MQLLTGGEKGKRRGEEERREKKREKRGPGEKEKRERGREKFSSARVFQRSKFDYIAFGFFVKTREVTDLPFMKFTIITLIVYFFYW